jgi:hypothetical protein
MIVMNYSRAGILPYIIHQEKRYYLFGVDRDYLTLLDFGGHRESYETKPLITALREMKEESHGLIKINMISKIEEPIIRCFKNSYNYEYLVLLNITLDDLYLITRKFETDNKLYSENELEHISLLIMREDDLINTLKYGKDNFYPIIKSTLLHYFDF